jgi:hypothetical protein
VYRDGTISLWFLLWFGHMRLSRSAKRMPRFSRRIWIEPFSKRAGSTIAFHTRPGFGITWKRLVSPITDQS